jgi:hypothetical protein
MSRNVRDTRGGGIENTYILYMFYVKIPFGCAANRK